MHSVVVDDFIVVAGTTKTDGAQQY
jgi:hypothetical protein